MANSTPTDIENKGDAWRLTAAMGAFIVALVTDPRAEYQYPGWLETRRRLTAMLERLPQERQLTALELYRPEELKAHERFVREQLGLADWANWVGPALMAAWECRMEGRDFSIPVSILVDTPVGKKPRADGQAIARNVQWFYRVKVKNPPDSISMVADEYATMSGRTTDARSVVQNGIQQAHALLDIVGRGRLVLPAPQYRYPVNPK